MAFRDHMAADLAAMMNPDEFGTTAIVGGTAVNGMFENAYAESLDIAGTAPAFICAAADAPDVAHGSAVVVDGCAYTVTAVKPSGDGLVTLVLAEGS